MKLMLLPVLILGFGCMPHYYELTPYYGTLDLGTRDIDAIDQGVMFTIGWAPQQRAHETRMEDLAVAHLASDTGLSTRVILDALQDSPEADDEHIPFIPDVPETEEDRWNVLTYALVLLIIACAAWIFKASGVSLPKRKPRGD